MIIGITGAVSTGKTTLSLLFSKKHGFYYLSLKELAEKNGLLNEFDEEANAYLVDVNDLEKCYEEELELIKMENENIIVESHLLVEQRFPLDKLLILRVSPLTLYARMLDRGYSVEKAYNNSLTEALDYFPITASKHYPSYLIYELNLSKKSKTESLKLIEKAVFKKINRVSYSFPKDLEKLVFMKH